MDIRHLDVIYLHGPHRPERKEHMDNLIKTLGLKGEPFIGVCDKGRQSGVYGMISVLEYKLKGEFKPFILLEDDCSATPWFTYTVPIPADADGIYVGISLYSLHPDFDKAVPVIQAVAVPEEPELVRIVNMLSTHAVLFNTRRWAEKCLEGYRRTYNEKGPDYDIYQARYIKDFNVYGMKRPLFYQDAKVGGQQEPTLIQLK
jgi:hypothetical protein